MVFHRIQSLRREKGKTQQAVADLLECRREVYRRYEKGITEIPVWAAIRLAEFYGTSTDYIFGLDRAERYPKE